MKLAGNIFRMEEGRSAFNNFNGYTYAKEIEFRHRWEDKIRTDLKEIGVIDLIGMIEQWLRTRH